MVTNCILFMHPHLIHQLEISLQLIHDDLYAHFVLFFHAFFQLEFDSCFHEHKSTRTIPIVYKINGYIFKYTKLFFYNFLVILFGFFLSFLWAIVLGITSFVLAWIWNPGLKALIIVVSTTLPAVTEPLKALFTPLVDVQARVFRQIRVQGWLNGGLLNPLLKKQDHVV